MDQQSLVILFAFPFCLIQLQLIHLLDFIILDMNVNLCEFFENYFVGAKRDSVNGIQYLMQMKGESSPKIMKSLDAKRELFYVPIILYLQNKIQWQDGASQNHEMILVEAAKPPKRVLCKCFNLYSILKSIELELIFIFS